MLTEPQAKRSYEKNKLFTALLGDAARPYCFLEFSAYRSVCVEFLDDLLRMYLHYSFQEKRPGEFFVSRATRREFFGDSDLVSKGDVYHFDVSGRLAIEHYKVDPDTHNSIILGRDVYQIDVTKNWEPFPEFGHYEGMSRINRHIPMLND